MVKVAMTLEDGETLVLEGGRRLRARALFSWLALRFLVASIVMDAFGEGPGSTPLMPRTTSSPFASMTDRGTAPNHVRAIILRSNRLRPEGVAET